MKEQKGTFLAHSLFCRHRISLVPAKDKAKSGCTETGRLIGNNLRLLLPGKKELCNCGWNVVEMVLDGVWRCHLLSSLCSSPFGFQVMCGELWPEYWYSCSSWGFRGVLSSSIRFWKCWSRGSSVTCAAQGANRKYWFGKKLSWCSALLERGNIETETAGPSGYLFAHSWFYLCMCFIKVGIWLSLEK